MRWMASRCRRQSGDALAQILQAKSAVPHGVVGHPPELRTGKSTREVDERSGDRGDRNPSVHGVLTAEKGDRSM